MAAYLYDAELLAKLKKWTENTQINVFGVDETRRLFEVIADDSKKDANITMPLISLSRANGYTILNINKTELSFDGVPIAASEEKTYQLNAIPIKLQYQLDIYTRKYVEADAISRELVFNIINHPELKIVIPYRDVNYEHNATLRISDTVEDTSGIPERLIPGQFTRLSLRLDIDDAYLFDVRARNNVQITDVGNTLEIRSSETDVVVESL